MAGGFRVDVKIKGSKEAQRELRRITAQAPKAVARALYQQGVQVWAESVRRAPVEFGVLRTSGYAAPPQVAGRNTYVEVGFGTRYAVFQHEGDYTHPRGGEQYFLRNAVANVASLERMAQLARANLEQGQGTEALSAQAPSRPVVRGALNRQERRRRRKARAERRRERRGARARALSERRGGQAAPAPARGGASGRAAQRQRIAVQREERRLLKAQRKHEAEAKRASRRALKRLRKAKAEPGTGTPVPTKVQKRLRKIETTRRRKERERLKKLTRKARKKRTRRKRRSRKP